MKRGSGTPSNNVVDGTHHEMALPVLTSAINGHDGSMMNNLQALNEWQKCKCILLYTADRALAEIDPSIQPPAPNMRSLLNVIQSVGSIVALPITHTSPIFSADVSVS